jgi:hypothetical protein
MDSSAVVGDVSEQMCKQHSGGEEKGKAWQQATRNGFGRAGEQRARSNLPALPNTMFIVVICQVSNGNDVVLSPNQLKPVYTNVRHWEELIDFLDKNGRPKEPYTLTSRFKCTLEKYQLQQEYMGLYTNGQMKTVPIYGQIFYNCCHPNAFKLKLGHDLKIFWSK